MGEPSQYYVDPSLGSDTGDGSLATPWGRASGSVVQYALDTITRDSTNGDQINVKSGATDTLGATLSLSSYGTPGVGAPLILRGYDSAKNDGGRGVISGGGSYQVINNLSSVSLIDLQLGDVGSNPIVYLGNYCLARSCKFHDSSGTSNYGLRTGIHGVCLGCEFTEIEGYGTYSVPTVQNCYFKQGISNTFNACIYNSGNNSNVSRNIMSLDGGSDGITFASNGFGAVVSHNSILSSSGTGSGIKQSGNTINMTFHSNLIEGFSGTGGYGLDINTGGSWYQNMCRQNAFYNNSTHHTTLSNIKWMDWDFEDNETLGASPFAKSGSDTFANRFTYFAPVDTGNVREGAYVGE